MEYQRDLTLVVMRDEELHELRAFWRCRVHLAHDRGDLMGVEQYGRAVAAIDGELACREQDERLV